MAVSVCSTRTIELFLFEMKHCIHCLNSRRAVNTALALEQMHGEKHKSILIKKTNYSNTLTVTLLQKSVQFSITLYFYSTWPHHDQPKRTGSMSQAQTPSSLKADLGDICSTPSVYFLPFSPCSSWCLTENPWLFSFVVLRQVCSASPCNFSRCGNAWRTFANWDFQAE